MKKESNSIVYDVFVDPIKILIDTDRFLRLPQRAVFLHFYYC